MNKGAGKMTSCKKLTSIFLLITLCLISMVLSISVFASEGDYKLMGVNKQQIVLFVDGSRESDVSQNRYKTVTEALAAAAIVSSEAKRVIIEIADGVYREQVIVNKPYITLRSASGDASKVTLTWYYGIGYVYNNIGPNGFYDPNVDWSADSTWEGLTRYKIGDSLSLVTYYDKNGVLHKNRSVKGGVLGKPDRWGCAVKLEKNAINFIAENITFENSFNFYITQEELDAGVTPEPQAVMKPDRAVLGAGSTVVERQNHIERAAALHTDSDRTIIKNSIIRGKQDTLYIGSNRILFDNCTIMGGTDYIFGGATAVFNECNLVFAGNEDNTNTGVITAGSHSPTTKYGYLFWNSTIDYRLDKTPKPGDFGRPWSNPLGAQVTFYGTTIKRVNNTLLISDSAWRAMGGTQGSEARFYEYGSVDENENAVNTTKRIVNSLAPMGTVLDEWQILEFNPRNYLKGNDNWDPLRLAQFYAGIDQVLDSTIVDTNVMGDRILLPNPPEGCSFSWASDSEYAVVSDDKTAINIIRPAYGEPAIRGTLILYVKDLAAGYGDKKLVPVQIEARNSAEDTFSVNGKVTLNAAAETDVSLSVVFSQKGVAIKKETIKVPANQKSIDYKAEYLPVGTYDVSISTVTHGYKVTSDETTTVTGTVGETKTLNVNVSKLVTIVIETTDFSQPWANPVVNDQAAGFAIVKYNSDGKETANLGTDNVVYKFTKEDGSLLPASTGGTWDLLAAVKANGQTLENTDTIQFSFDFLMESVDYLPNDYSYFDLAASLTNKGSSSTDDTRFVRWGVHHNWTQFNMFGADNARVNGDKTQFHINDEMANKWYRIAADIDLKNQIITTTLYNRDANRILNKKAFNVAAPDKDGNNPAYPKAADLSKGLYFSIYMDNKRTPHKMEYYFDNFKLQYQDYSDN